MTKLIMCKGLPGSGKSTWAAQQKAVVVCKDDIRAELEKTGWVWSPENEKQVIKIRDSRIFQGLLAGCDVISADTNLVDKHETSLRRVASIQRGTEFEIKDFTNVPVDVCIERDSKREKPVGKEVIMDMWQRYVFPKGLVPYSPQEELPSAVICDLDGTLALHQGRSPFDYAKLGTDRVCKPVLQLLQFTPAHIIYMSGREDWCKDLTETWLKDNGCPSGSLYMRKTKDNRKDDFVKYELFNEHVRDKFNVQWVVDDRNRVVKMWRTLGLTCFQVAEGDF